MDYKELIVQIQELLASYEKVRYGEYVGAPWPYSHAGPLIYTEPEGILLDLSMQAINDLQKKLDKANNEKDAAIKDLERAIEIYRDDEGWDLLCRFCNGKSCREKKECVPKWRGPKKEE